MPSLALPLSLIPAKIESPLRRKRRTLVEPEETSDPQDALGSVEEEQGGDEKEEDKQEEVSPPDATETHDAMPSTQDPSSDDAPLPSHADSPQADEEEEEVFVVTNDAAATSVQDEGNSDDLVLDLDPKRVTLRELKQMCTDRGISTAGKKEDLIARLQGRS